MRLRDRVKMIGRLVRNTPNAELFTGIGGLESYYGKLPKVNGKDFIPENEAYNNIRTHGETIPAIYAAVNIRVNLLSRLDLTLVRMIDYGLGINEQVDGSDKHLACILWNQAPHPAFDVASFRRLVMRPFVSRGNSVTYIERDAGGAPVRLTPATLENPSWQMKQNPRTGNNELVFRLFLWPFNTGTTGGFDPKGGFRQVQAFDSDVLRMHGHGSNGVWAPSPIEFYARLVYPAMYHSYQRQANSLRDGIGRSYINANHGMMEDFLAHDKETRQEIATTIQEQMAGAANAGNTPVFPPGYDVANMGMSPADLQLIDFLKMSITDIARIWSVPLRALQQYDMGTRVGANVDLSIQNEDLINQTTQFDAVVYAQQLTHKLLSAQEKQSGQRLHLSTSRLRMGSYHEESQTAVAEVKSGIISPNEARSKLGWAQSDQDEMDTIRMRRPDESRDIDVAGPGTGGGGGDEEGEGEE